ncbi:unnamed protein product, partial [Durusdinium trenchii]
MVMHSIAAILLGSSFPKPVTAANKAGLIWRKSMGHRNELFLGPGKFSIIVDSNNNNELYFKADDDDYGERQQLTSLRYRPTIRDLRNGCWTVVFKDGDVKLVHSRSKRLTPEIRVIQGAPPAANSNMFAVLAAEDVEEDKDGEENDDGCCSMHPSSHDDGDDGERVLEPKEHA